VHGQFQSGTRRALRRHLRQKPLLAITEHLCILTWVLERPVYLGGK
jgi:hypothetical protein